MCSWRRLRAASMVALRNGLRELGINESNQVALFEDLMDSKSLWLTPNSETVYAFHLPGPEERRTHGSWESPPNVLGILDDMWMRYIGDLGNAGPDKGKGGKYLVLAFRDTRAKSPRAITCAAPRTYGVWLIIRGFLVDGKTGPAVTNIKKHLKIYPLGQSQECASHGI